MFRTWGGAQPAAPNEQLWSERNLVFFHALSPIPINKRYTRVIAVQLLSLFLQNPVLSVLTAEMEASESNAGASSDIFTIRKDR